MVCYDEVLNGFLHLCDPVYKRVKFDDEKYDAHYDNGTVRLGTLSACSVQRHSP